MLQKGCFDMNIWKIVIGILFILGGGLFILANMGVIPSDVSLPLETYWPSLIILASVVMVIDTLLKKYKPKKMFNHLYFAFCVFVTGFVLQNEKLNFVTVKGVDLWEVIVALVLVYIGIRLIFFKSHSIHGHGVKIEVDTDGTGFKDVSGEDEHAESENESQCGCESGSETRADSKDGAKRKGVFVSSGGNREQFVGDMRLGDSAWAPESGSYSVNIGDMNVNFTTAIFSEGETAIDLSCWVGEIIVIIPDDLPVDMEMETNVGEVVFSGHAEKSGITNNVIKYRSEGYDEAPTKLKLRASLNIGSIKVTKV